MQSFNVINSDSNIGTEFTSASSSVSTSGAATNGQKATLERKHRLASLAPLVFHLAFTHGDPVSLEIVASQARLMAMARKKGTIPDF